MDCILYLDMGLVPNARQHKFDKCKKLQTCAKTMDFVNM